MRQRFAVPFVLGLLAALAPAVRAQSRDEARPRDLQRLQEDLANLDEELRGLEPNEPKADDFRRRAEEIREDAVYLKVKARRHQKAGLEGAGVSADEVEDLRRSVADLRDDIDRAFATERRREVRVAEGTHIVVRLDDSLSSRTAQREDRCEASVVQPVRAEGIVAIPAGTRLRGIVRDVAPARRPSQAGRLELEFDALYLHGTRLDIRGRVHAIHEHDERAEKAGIGAVLGGIVGGVLGGAKGAVVGLIVGGTGAVAATTGDDVELPAGTVLTVRLERPLTVPRR